ncbi:Beta-TrCP [Pseudocercospora fuligena]|uniref:Beta-TrCP n=1 Tax=Pseudocercospora fuligena TaxID=685502 RepID=A0A8H6RQE3_9PEZI|nr:Beta-TrCP [Pseudocercospora fuligena]
MQTPFDQLPYSRPRIPEQRPHTVHASTSSSSATPVNFIAEEAESSEDNDTTPRASAAGMNAPGSFSRRRMSRDDTANDMHQMASAVDAVSKLRWSGAPLSFAPEDRLPEEARQETLRHSRRARKPLYRLPIHSTGESSDSSQGTHGGGEKSASLGRRLSRTYQERINGFRESMQKYALPGVSSGRVRRSSTPNRVEVTDEASTCIDPALLSLKPPTSPSKRTARQGDERPRKHRHFLPLGDRKDTPAPTTYGLPVRPASSRFTPTIGTAPGGDAARKAAAMHNNPGLSPTSLPSEWLPEYDDIDVRRSRLGSLSSAADSGADLSNYTASIRDSDGDIDMSYHTFAAPSQHDFTFVLPNELALAVLKNLDAKDLINAEQVSRRWKSLIEDPSVWRTIFYRRYQRQVMTNPAPIQVGGIGVGRPNRPDQAWRKMYKARVDLEKNWRAGSTDAGKAVYLSGHTDSVYCLQFDEEKIITGSRDRTIRVWDINTYQCLRVIGRPNVKPALGPKVLRTVDYPSFHMATASVNGTAYGEGIFYPNNDCHDASILCLQYDDEILVTGSSDNTLLVWDVKTYEIIKRLKSHTGGVLDVALDAKHIVSCSKDSKIIVWDRENLVEKGQLTGHKGPVNAVQLRGNLLVSASGDGIARLWDLNQMKLIKEFPAKERGLAAVEFSEDMKYVLAGGNDNITYKFETETGREVMQFAGHTQLVRSLWLDSSNNRVISGSYDLDLRVYDFVTGEELWRGEEWTTSWMLAAKSDYRRIVATSQDGRILIVDFGILKGAPTYQSRDGMPIDNIDLLRGIEHTNEIRFTNPFSKSSTHKTFR